MVPVDNFMVCGCVINYKAYRWIASGTSTDSPFYRPTESCQKSLTLRWFLTVESILFNFSCVLVFLFLCVCVCERERERESLFLITRRIICFLRRLLEPCSRRLNKQMCSSWLLKKRQCSSVLLSKRRYGIILWFSFNFLPFSPACERPCEQHRSKGLHILPEKKCQWWLF